MSEKELAVHRKSFVIKVAFLIVLLTFAGLMYIESSSLIDAVYFIIVLAILIRFITMKLYP